MRRSLKALAACAAFTVCMCAMMVISYAADLKINPTALVINSGEATSDEGALVTGNDLFIGLEDGSYTFNDVAQTLADYGLQYEVTDGANGSVYLIGSVIELGPSGTFDDLLAADASYHYYIVGDSFMDVVASIGAQNAGEAASVIVAGASEAIQEQAPEIFDNVTGAIDQAYENVMDAVSEAADNGVFDDAQEFVGGIVDDVNDALSGVDWDSLISFFLQ